MSADLLWALDVIGALVGLGLFLLAVTVEAGIDALSRARVHQLVERGEGQARRLDTFLDQPARHVVAAQVLRTFGGVVATAFAVAIVDRWLGLDPGTVLLIAVVGFGLLTLLIALPRGVAIHNPERTMLRLYVPTRIATAILGPIVHGLNRVGGTFAQLVGVARVSEGPTMTPDDLHMQASSARESGLIEEDEQDMIDSIFELDNTTAREVMVPRMDVVALPSSATIDEAVDVISSRGYSRLPVYDGSIDHIVGVLYAKDLFRLLRASSTDQRVAGLLRPAYFIPESKKTDELLRELQRQKVHIAIVADEYGGTAGLVTIEDLLEEIVGEIQDEYDHEESKIVQVSADEAVFDATVSIDDVNDTLDLNLTGEDVDTIGGLLYEHLGKVPALGDEAQLDHALLRVESTAGRRLRKVRVTRRGTERTAVGAA